MEGSEQQEEKETEALGSHEKEQEKLQG